MEVERKQHRDTDKTEDDHQTHEDPKLLDGWYLYMKEKNHGWRREGMEGEKRGRREERKLTIEIAFAKKATAVVMDV